MIAVLPSVLMGIGGGVLGSAFTHVNLIFAKWRKEYMAKIKSKACSNLIRLLEPICILTIMTTIHVFLPQFLGCTEVDCTYTTSATSNETSESDTYTGPKVNECYPTNPNHSKVCGSTLTFSSLVQILRMQGILSNIEFMA